MEGGRERYMGARKGEKNIMRSVTAGFSGAKKISGDGLKGGREGDKEAGVTEEGKLGRK